jgi:hypothetical protein
MVIETIINGFENRLEFTEVPDPASARVRLTLDVDSHLKGMSMQASAFVPIRYMG